MKPFVVSVFAVFLVACSHPRGHRPACAHAEQPVPYHVTVNFSSYGYEASLFVNDVLISEVTDAVSLNLMHERHPIKKQALEKYHPRFCLKDHGNELRIVYQRVGDPTDTLSVSVFSDGKLFEERRDDQSGEFSFCFGIGTPPIQEP